MWLLDKLADLSKRYANILSDWTVPYDFVLYSHLSNSFKNAWIDILAGLLDVSNASKAWNLVIVGSFLNYLFKHSVIASSPFTLAISSSPISSAAAGA